MKVVVTFIEKKCTGCRKLKKIEDFHASRRANDGRTSRCKSCLSEADRKRKTMVKIKPEALKQCRSCKALKDVDLFHRDSYQKDGCSRICKKCVKSRDQQRTRKTALCSAIVKRCSKCNQDLPPTAFCRASRSKDGLDTGCRECRRKHRQSNQDRIAEKNRIWYKKNQAKELLKAKDRRRKNRARHNFYNATRHAVKLKATPPWLTDDQKKEIELMYTLSRTLEEQTGTKYNVDHIHPLRNRLSCGLHVPWNLQVIKASDNSMKRNKLILELGLTG